MVGVHVVVDLFSAPEFVDCVLDVDSLVIEIEEVIARTTEALHIGLQETIAAIRVLDAGSSEVVREVSGVTAEASLRTELVETVRDLAAGGKGSALAI